jgi:hypothetical protein
MPLNLFKVNKDCEKLKLNKAAEFHNLVAKTLYATKRARLDTCTAIAFLTTRVHVPDKDDWMKLVHLMQYIRGTRKLPLILSANGSGILKWWVDASFAVHPNMRGHSGGGLSLGQGFPIVNKFRNLIMGVVPVKDLGTGKVKPQKSKSKVCKDKTCEQKVSSFAPLPSKEGATGVCWRKSSLRIDQQYM